MEQVLVVVAHPDDETLGCGGSIIRHIQKGDHVTVISLTDGEGSRDHPNVSSRVRNFENAMKALGVPNYILLSYKDQHLDTYPLVSIVKEICSATPYAPSIIYTHSPADLNLDHRITYFATLTSFRALPNTAPQRILTFEIPSSIAPVSLTNNGMFTPNYFIELSEKELQKKIEVIKMYQDEMKPFPHPRSEEYLIALARVRGGAVGVNAAEGFFLEREIVRS